MKFSPIVEDAHRWKCLIPSSISIPPLHSSRVHLSYLEYTSLVIEDKIETKLVMNEIITPKTNQMSF